MLKGEIILKNYQLSINYQLFNFQLSYLEIENLDIDWKLAIEN